MALWNQANVHVHKQDGNIGSIFPTSCGWERSIYSLAIVHVFCPCTIKMRGTAVHSGEGLEWNSSKTETLGHLDIMACRSKPHSSQVFENHLLVTCTKITISEIHIARVHQISWCNIILIYSARHFLQICNIKSGREHAQPAAGNERWPQHCSESQCSETSLHNIIMISYMDCCTHCHVDTKCCRTVANNSLLMYIQLYAFCMALWKHKIWLSIHNLCNPTSQSKRKNIHSKTASFLLSLHL